MADLLEALLPRLKTLLSFLRWHIGSELPSPKIQGCEARLVDISPSGSFMYETNWEKSRSKLGTMMSFRSLHRNCTVSERSCWRLVGKSTILK